MTIEHITTIQFGKDGNSDDHVGAGWSVAEDGYRWMVGAFSELRLGPLTSGARYFLVLDSDPFVRPGILERQRLSLSIDGIPFAEAELTANKQLGFRIPQELVGSENITIGIDHPDAARPSELLGEADDRPLAVLVRTIGIYQVHGEFDETTVGGNSGIPIAKIEPLTGLPPDRFITTFESLGENCEFGLVQRRCGAEPLSLLRFSNTLLPALLNGLATGFKGLGEAGDLEYALEGGDKKEYIIKEKKYGLVYHTFRYQGEIDEAKFFSNEPVRLTFLVRKFSEDLKGGEKILVCKRNIPLSEQEILPLLAAVSVYGENTLLWVVLADEKHPAGSVHWVMPGLIKAYIDRFAPNENAHDMSFNVWLEICANAFKLR